MVKRLICKTKFGPTLKIDQKQASQYEAGYAEIYNPDMLTQKILMGSLEGYSVEEPTSFGTLGPSREKETREDYVLTTSN
jgi:hypothetical protein